MQAVLASDGFNDKLERLDLVGRFDRICIFKVDLMLSWSNLMVGSLNFKAHFL
ncbi:hypothetical protein D3C80_2221090 [compost metagenome]